MSGQDGPRRVDTIAPPIALEDVRPPRWSDTFPGMANRIEINKLCARLDRMAAEMAEQFARLEAARRRGR